MVDHDAATPVFVQIRETLREQIAQGKFSTNGALPDERSLAAQFGLSRMTVRRALLDLTREGLLIRVQGKGTFVKGAVYSTPRRSNPPMVALVVPSEVHSLRHCLYFHRMITGILSATEKAGLCVAFKHVTGPYDSFVSALKTDPAVKGLILLGHSGAEEKKLFAKLQIPAVLVDSVQPDERAPIFDEANHDSHAAIREAITSLIHLGHRDIALYMHDTSISIHQHRRDAFEAALRAAGLPVRPDRILAFNPSSEKAYAITKRLLSTPGAPTAIFCSGGDEVVMGILNAIQARGWSIPRDCSLLSFGDTLPFTIPGISTIRVPWEQIGANAVNILAARLKDPKAPLIRVYAPCEYLPRASCDTPRAAAPENHTS
jgi:DNA-binding LacI/PurR family transcriptional regulator